MVPFVLSYRPPDPGTVTETDGPIQLGLVPELHQKTRMPGMLHVLYRRVVMFFFINVPVPHRHMERLTVRVSSRILPADSRAFRRCFDAA